MNDYFKLYFIDDRWETTSDTILTRFESNVHNILTPNSSKK